MGVPELKKMFPENEGAKLDYKRAKKVFDIRLKMTKNSDIGSVIYKLIFLLSKKYPDAAEYLLFQMASGSTGVKTSRFDISGEDSIEKLYESYETAEREKKLEKFLESLKSKLERIKTENEKIKELKEIIGRLYETDAGIEAVAKRAEELRIKFGKLTNNYSLYHVLAGSGVSGDAPTAKFDFDEPDSIETFLRNKIKTA